MATQRRHRRSRRAARRSVWILALFVACADEEARDARPGPHAALAPADTTASDTTMPNRPIEVVQEEHTPALMALAGVTGTFIGATADGRPCIKIMVVQRTPELERRLPQELDGYPVEIVESGHIRPLGDRR